MDSLVLVRCEKHVLADGVLYGTGGFAQVLDALSAMVSALVIVVPVVTPGAEYDGERPPISQEGRIGYRLRSSDRVIALPDLTGYARLVRHSVQVVTALARARAYSDRILLRAPEHASLVVFPVAAALWRQRAVWLVADRRDYRRLFGSNQGRFLAKLLDYVLARIERTVAAHSAVAANGTELAVLADQVFCSPVVARVISTTLSRLQVQEMRALRQAHATARLARRCKRVLYVGRLTPEKGVEQLMAAVAQVHSRRPGEIELRLVGWGVPAYENSLRQLSEAIGQLVTFAGPVPFGSALFSEYAQADAFCLASRGVEGTPRALAEAICAGLPFVSTTCGGIPDVVGPELAPTLLPPQVGSTLLADALERVLFERNYASWLEEVVARRAADLSAERTAKTLLSLFP